MIKTEKKKLIVLAIFILIVVPGALTVGFYVGYESCENCTMDLIKCKSDLLFYEQLVKECDSCIARLTNNSDTFIACQQEGD